MSPTSWNFSGDWPSWWLSIAIGCGLAMAVAGALVARWRAWNDRQRHTPRRLLNELFAAHQLRRPQRRLIRQLAQELKLDHPALLFLEPSLWEAARAAEFGRKHTRELAILERQLFELPAG
jgi:integral membrane sensor domain MASE1